MPLAHHPLKQPALALSAAARMLTPPHESPLQVCRGLANQPEAILAQQQGKLWDNVSAPP